jgi:hypothetical protein
VISVKSKKKGATPYVLKSATGLADAVEKIVSADPTVPGQVGAPLPGKVMLVVIDVM